MARSDDIGYPPPEIGSDEVVVKVKQNRGSTFDVEVPASEAARVARVLPSFTQNQLLVGLSPKLRNKFFVRRNGLVLVALEDVGRVQGEIINVVADPRVWEKALPEFPTEYKVQKETSQLDLPPGLSDEDEEGGEDEYKDEEDDAEVTKP